MLRWNPHFHAIVLDGGFDDEGTFFYIPFSELQSMTELFPRRRRRCAPYSRSIAREVPSELQDRVEVSAAEPVAIIALLEREGRSHVYVDGGPVVQSFLAAGLIDELTITRIPILIGEGIPLFGPLPGDQLLEHVETRTLSLGSSHGIVQSRYRVPARRF